MQKERLQLCAGFTLDEKQCKCIVYLDLASAGRVLLHKPLPQVRTTATSSWVVKSTPSLCICVRSGRHGISQGISQCISIQREPVSRSCNASAHRLLRSQNLDLINVINPLTCLCLIISLLHLAPEVVPVGTGLRIYGSAILADIEDRAPQARNLRRPA